VCWKDLTRLAIRRGVMAVIALSLLMRFTSVAILLSSTCNSIILLY